MAQQWTPDVDDDRDAPQPSDLVDYDDEIECSNCGRLVYEDAPRCPGCGHWMDGDLPGAAARSRGWFWPVMIALLVAIILVLWHGLGR